MPEIALPAPASRARRVERARPESARRTAAVASQAGVDTASGRCKEHAPGSGERPVVRQRAPPTNARKPSSSSVSRREPRSTIATDSRTGTPQQTSTASPPTRGSFEKPTASSRSRLPTASGHPIEIEPSRRQISAPALAAPSAPSTLPAEQPAAADDPDERRRSYPSTAGCRESAAKWGLGAPDCRLGAVNDAALPSARLDRSLTTR